MQRLKAALELLDHEISALEARLEMANFQRAEAMRKQTEIVRISKSREAKTAASSQKVAARLDKTINAVEDLLRDLPG